MFQKDVIIQIFKKYVLFVTYLWYDIEIKSTKLLYNIDTCVMCVLYETKKIAEKL